jgi:hypothetical protein
VDAAAGRPVLILGLTPRTGTNYLWDLLCMHTDCAPGREPIREDLFLNSADKLMGYVESVRSGWDPAWGAVDEDVVAQLCASLGRALLHFLTVDTNRRLVTKNPSVANIRHVFTLFPDAQVILLVRDGRAVVESCMRTFGWDFDLACRRWAGAATEALEFLGDRDSNDPCVRLVQYEDLVADPQTSLRKLLSFLQLNQDCYDFTAAELLPVRGSSVFLGGRHDVHWEPVERTAAFDPLHRWEHWDRDARKRFAWLAGSQQSALGYDLDAPGATTATERAEQRLTSAWWRLRRGARLSEFRLRGWVGPPTRGLRQRLGVGRAP